MLGVLAPAENKWHVGKGQWLGSGGAVDGRHIAGCLAVSRWCNKCCLCRWRWALGWQCSQVMGRWQTASRLPEMLHRSRGQWVLAWPCTLVAGRWQTAGLPEGYLRHCMSEVGGGLPPCSQRCCLRSHPSCLLMAQTHAYSTDTCLPNRDELPCRQRTRWWPRCRLRRTPSWPRQATRVLCLPS